MKRSTARRLFPVLFFESISRGLHRQGKEDLFGNEHLK